MLTILECCPALGEADKHVGQHERAGEHSYRSSIVKELAALAAYPWAIGSEMSEDRSRMIQSLKTTVVPDLRRRGFAGSFPHFRRPTETAIHLLTFQFDKWGGGFVAEIAVCPRSGALTGTGEHVPPERVTAHSVSHRLRLGASAEGRDHWFRYDGVLRRLSKHRFDRASRQVLALLDGQAEPWWQRAAEALGQGGDDVNPEPSA